MYGEDALKSTSAFRQAEKKYQLHYKQKFKKRSGRTRGAGVEAKRTDFSEVLDFAEPKSLINSVIAVETPQGQGFGLLEKPGFLFLPGALSTAEQWQLVLDCLLQFPEPPSDTNHTAQQGRIPHLWRAAREGLRWVPGAQNSSSTRDSVTLPSAEEVTGVDLQPGGKWVTGDSSEGTPADKLLNKLRWASLGPNFDWTARRYLYEQPQQSLPLYLFKIAQRCVSSTKEGQHTLTTPTVHPDSKIVAQSEAWTEERSPNGLQKGSTLYSSHLQQTLSDATSSTGWSSEDLRAAGGPGNASTSQEGGCTEDSHSEGHGTEASQKTWDSRKGDWFEPDAALINYYSAGETLGGHTDDVEADLTNPIVSISLGCDAIFLLGGKERETTPIAMRVRSGDLIILAGAARSFYHGVPRILENTSPLAFDPDQPTPHLIDRELSSAVVRHMAGRRINISVRCTI